MQIAWFMLQEYKYYNENKMFSNKTGASNKTVLKFREAMSKSATYDQYDTVPDDRFGSIDKDWLILKNYVENCFSS